MKAGTRQVVPGAVVKVAAFAGRVTPRSLLMPTFRYGGRALR
jgi:hypothetical protein